MTEDAEQLFHLYLSDHLAGARGGVELAKRAASAEEGRSAGADLAVIARDLEEDLSSLRTLCEALGAPTHAPAKEAAAAVGEKLGRLKPNRRVSERSPLSEVLEIELLQGAVSAKRHLWETFMHLPEMRSSHTEPSLPALLERADDQFQRLGTLHRGAVQRAFRDPE
jgi:hypothetical protein